MALGRDSDRLRVLAWPGLGARAKNPYTWLLYSHLAALGVRVRDFTPLRALCGGYDILHVHWPEKAMMTGRAAGRVAGALVGRTVLAAAWRHGARVVWTAHNARPHDAEDTALERWYWSAVIRSVDAVIYPSAATRERVEATYATLTGRPHSVIRMGHYHGSYPDTMSRREARAGFGIPEGVAVLGFLGLLRPYKNVPHLIATVRALPPERPVVLLVGGAPLDASLAAEIERAAGGDPRVRLTLRHVPDEDVQRFLRAADLIVLPFTDITNSGSALLALTFSRPVLVPGRGAMGELRELVGDDWVRTYAGELTPAILDEAIAWALAPRPDAPDLSPLDWKEIARQTLELYRVAAAGSSPKA